MAVIQPALAIPDDIYSRLLTGEYVRLGGVVRDQAGRLVTLLDDAFPLDNAQEAAQANIAKIEAEDFLCVYKDDLLRPPQRSRTARSAARC